MFDLIVKGHRHTPHRDAVPMMLSLGLHSMAAVTLVVVPVLYMTNPIPQASRMMAFVAAVPPPPPPPPPAPPVETVAPKPPAPAFELVAPIEEPTAIAPESSNAEREGEGDAEGGVPGGVIGGFAADIPSPPPPPPPVATAPVRVGGEIRPPTLVSRVGPVYPELAVGAHVEGVVILEAVVNREGRVQDVRVLRSIPLLDGAAVDAVRQWRYEPLVVNGHTVVFVLTVTVTFQLTPGA